MLSPPHDVDVDALVQVVEDAVGYSIRSIEFVPVGEDSWCYQAGDLWISLRRDLRGHWAAAYEATCAMQELGLNFVLAPRRGLDGEVVRRLGSYPVLIFPYRRCVSLESRGACTDRATIARSFERLHAVETLKRHLPVETFELQFEADLDLAAEIGARDPETGPLSQQLHRVLSANQRLLSSMRQEFAEMARAVRKQNIHYVPTHGEPIASNILYSDEEMLVCDWGELAWAPPERDWSHLVRSLGIRPARCRSQVMRLYDLRWVLSEIAEYASQLGVTHDGSPDDRAMVVRLMRYLPIA